MQRALLPLLLLGVTGATLWSSARFGVRAADTTLRTWTENRPPSFVLDALAGSRTDLSELRGRVVLVHFFATWCEPCRAELASLQGLDARLRQRPFTILAVDAGEVDSRVQRFFATSPVSFPILLDRDGAVGKAWRVYALPTTFLLDSDLMPRFVAEGDLDWNGPPADDAVTRLIGTKAAGRDPTAHAPL